MPDGTWPWPVTRWWRCPRAAADACRSCFRCCGCSWPGTWSTSRSWPRRRSGCSPSPRAPTPQGLALAREIGRPYLELHGLAHGAHAMPQFRPDTSQEERSRQAIELAERHGWGEEPLAGVAYTQLGIVLLYQGRLEEAEPWLERAEQTLRTKAEPAAGMSLRHARAVLELARGRPQEALAAFRAAEKLAAALAGPRTCVTSMRSRMLHTLVRAGQTGHAEQVLAELGEDERASAEIRTAEAALRLASDDPQAAADAL